MGLSVLFTILAQLLVLLFSFTFQDEIIPIMSNKPVMCAAGDMEHEQPEAFFIAESQSRCARTRDGFFEFLSVVVVQKNVTCTETERDDGFAIASAQHNLTRPELVNCEEIRNQTYRFWQYNCENAALRCGRQLEDVDSVCVGFLFIENEVFMPGPGATRTFGGDTDEVQALKGVTKEEAKSALEEFRVSTSSVQGGLMRIKTKRICTKAVKVDQVIGTHFNEWSLVVIGTMVGLTVVGLACYFLARARELEINTLFHRRDYVILAMREMFGEQAVKHSKFYTWSDANGSQEFSLSWREGCTRSTS